MHYMMLPACVDKDLTCGASQPTHCSGTRPQEGLHPLNPAQTHTHTHTHTHARNTYLYAKIHERAGIGKKPAYMQILVPVHVMPGSTFWEQPELASGETEEMQM